MSFIGLQGSWVLYFTYYMLPYQLLHFTPTLCCKKVWISEFPPSCISCRWKVCYFCLVICGAENWAETGNSEGVRYRETCKLYINIGPTLHVSSYRVIILHPPYTMTPGHISTRQSMYLHYSNTMFCWSIFNIFILSVQKISPNPNKLNFTRKTLENDLLITDCSRCVFSLSEPW